jgi:hypothetical protein
MKKQLFMHFEKKMDNYGIINLVKNICLIYTNYLFNTNFIKYFEL